MWNAQKRQRFQELRALPHPRTSAEQSELDTLVKELESAESLYLSEATQRMRAEREQVKSRDRLLESLASRRRGLAERLENTLAQASAERQAIEAELATVLSAGE